jgi:deazaflavin-dependent oxidoreductase (nitroreductase family)
MPSQPDSTQPVRKLRMRRIDRVGDAVFRVLARLRIGPAWVLTTRGRRTGKLRHTPVIPISEDGRQWLVAPYGGVSWVRNARAAGQVQLSRGRTKKTCSIRQALPHEAGPILKQYVQIASATRPYFAVSTDAPVSAFVAEADRHPVFELTPLDASRSL